MSDESQVIAEEAGQLLESAAAQAVFARLRARYLGEFEESTTPAERERVHAKVKVVKEFQEELRALKDSGTSRLRR